MLDLSNTNRIGEMDAVDLAVLNRTLTHLWIDNNPEFTAGPLPSFLESLTKLITLDLSNTNRNGFMNASNLAMLNQTLRVLHIQDNSKFIAGPIPRYMELLTNLKAVSLKGTNRNNVIDPSRCALALAHGMPKNDSCNATFFQVTSTNSSRGGQTTVSDPMKPMWTSMAAATLTVTAVSTSVSTGVYTTSSATASGSGLSPGDTAIVALIVGLAFCVSCLAAARFTYTARRSKRNEAVALAPDNGIYTATDSRNTSEPCDERPSTIINPSFTTSRHMGAGSEHAPLSEEGSGLHDELCNKSGTPDAEQSRTVEHIITPYEEPSHLQNVLYAEGRVPGADHIRAAQQSLHITTEQKSGFSLMGKSQNSTYAPVDETQNFKYALIGESRDSNYAVIDEFGESEYAVVDEFLATVRLGDACSLGNADLHDHVAPLDAEC